MDYKGPHHYKFKRVMILRVNLCLLYNRLIYKIYITSNNYVSSLKYLYIKGHSNNNSFIFPYINASILFYCYINTYVCSSFMKNSANLVFEKLCKNANFSFKNCTNFDNLYSHCEKRRRRQRCI